MSKESLENKKKRIKKMIKLLKRYYPSVQCALTNNNPLQLLISTILSAQCTDKRVNIVTKTLFKKYRSVRDFAKSSLQELEENIRSTGFFRSKADKIKNTCKKLIKDFNGKVPSNMEDLVSLPGVGRKTANVVLGTAFNISSGVVVDTHVSRLSYRLNFTSFKDAVKIEQNLIDLLPVSQWIYFSHALILHGRQVCKARKPQCHVCFLSELCPQTGVSKTPIYNKKKVSA